MTEKLDPYFCHRLEQGKAHKKIQEIKFVGGGVEVPANKELPNPFLEGAIEDLGWSERAVDNIIDAMEKGYIQISKMEGETLRIEFLPIEKLPKELGQVSELDVVRKNLKSRSNIFGDQAIDKLTYLQTVDFAVEGYMSDEEHGKEYGRIFVATDALLRKRNVYIDPESLHITDYEYGYAFCVWGGLPVNAIDRIEVIRAVEIDFKSSSGEANWIDDPEDEMAKQASRLRNYLTNKI